MGDRCLTHTDALRLAKGEATWGDLAVALGVSRYTLHLWRKQNFVPENRRQAVIDYAGGKVRVSDFNLPYSDYRQAG